MKAAKHSFPKIIHQIYGFWDGAVPRHIRKRIDTWKDLHPDYTHMLWDKKNSRDLIKQHYPWFLGIYDSYTYPIQRADAVRYFFLHYYGGIYSDIDLDPVKNIDPLLSRFRRKLVLLYKSPNSELITNDFMVSAPKASFWKRVWHELILGCTFSSISKHLTVMHSTGPLMLDRAYERSVSRKRLGVTTMPAKLVNACDIAEKKPCYNKEAYLRRYEGNSWHGTDSTVLNFLYKNYIAIAVVAVLVAVIVALITRRSTSCAENEL